MIIKKRIEVGIDVRNCINLFSSPDNLKEFLIDRFEGRCFRDCYIQKIDKIVRQSVCTINQDGSPDFGTISVVCDVTAIVYASGEIINGCKITQHDKNTIICSTDIASIMIIAKNNLESLTKGQLISIRVSAVRYTQGVDKVSISGVALSFTNRPIIYKFYRNDDNISLKSLFANVIERIKFEESEMNKIMKENPKAWDTFDQLLYAYKESQKNPNFVTVANIMQLVNEMIDKKIDYSKIRYVSRDPKLYLSKPDIYVYNSADSLPPDAILRNDLTDVEIMVLMLEDYCAHLRTIREMIAIYNTQDLLVSHKNLWQIYRKNKF